MPAISLASVPDQFDGAVGFTVAEGSDWTGALATMDAACDGAIKRTAEAAGFDGSKGKTLLVLGAGASAPARIVLTGLGADAPSALDLNKAGASLMAEVATRGDASLTLVPHDGSAASAAALLEGAAMRAYRFDAYRTRLKDEQRQSVTAIVGLCADPDGGADDLEQAAARLAPLAAVAYGRRRRDLARRLPRPHAASRRVRVRRTALRAPA